MKKLWMTALVLAGIISFSSCRETTEEKAKEAMEAAGEDIENNLEKAGQAIEKAAEETGDAIEKAANEIEEEIEGTDEMTGEDDN